MEAWISTCVLSQEMKQNAKHLQRILPEYYRKLCSPVGQVYRSIKKCNWRNWDFGDGTNSTQQNPEHTYFAAGYYRVTLTASNEYGTDVKRIGIIVQNAPHTTPAGFNFISG